MALAAGDRLGSDVIRDPLGAGGMGEVYRAADTKLGREVAIKVLPSEVARDPERLARFEREAHLLASLNHPSIAAIYGLEDEGGSPFLVLELVAGEDVAERLAAGCDSDQRGARDRTTDRPGPGGGSREGDHPPRPEAGQRPRPGSTTGTATR